MAKEGIAVVVISSELPELVGICDRVLVMGEGKIAGEVGNAPGMTPLTQENIVAIATAAFLQANWEATGPFNRKTLSHMTTNTPEAKTLRRPMLVSSFQALGMLPILILLALIFQFLSGFKETFNLAAALTSGRFISLQNLSIVAA
jgi:ABC-type methionine transport system ATPase subunit